MNADNMVDHDQKLDLELVGSGELNASTDSARIVAAADAVAEFFGRIHGGGELRGNADVIYFAATKLLEDARRKPVAVIEVKDGDRIEVNGRVYIATVDDYDDEVMLNPVPVVS